MGLRRNGTFWWEMRWEVVACFRLFDWIGWLRSSPAHSPFFPACCFLCCSPINWTPGTSYFVQYLTYGISSTTYCLMSRQGCAFLHVSKQHQPMIKPLVVSAGYGAGFNSQFIWTGAWTVIHSIMLVINYWLNKLKGFCQTCSSQVWCTF